MTEEECMDDVFWDLHVDAPNLAYNARSFSGDELDDDTPYQSVSGSRTSPNENVDEWENKTFISCVGKGEFSGYGLGGDITAVVAELLELNGHYHFEFKFWKVDQGPADRPAK